MPLRLAIAGKPDSQVNVTIRDVYYHERIDANLLSWGSMRLDGWEMHSDANGTYFVTPKGKRVNASTRGRLTLLEDAGPERALAIRLGRFVCRSADDLVSLHHRLGHTSWTRMIEMCRAKATDGIGDISSMSADELKKAESRVKTCEACATGKQHKNALGRRGLDKGTMPGEVIHMDAFYVTMRNPSTNKKYNEYCLLGTDGYTEMRWVAKAITLRDLQDEVINMIQTSRITSGRLPRLIVTDLGTEFNNQGVKNYCSRRGIHLQCTPARAKELNGVSEKGVDTVKNHVRAMLRGCGMPVQMGWSRAVNHHAFIWNRTHIASKTGKTPYEAMSDREPSIVNVGVFGCDALVHQDRTQRDTTFSAKAEPGIYLGHDFKQNCAVVHMLRTGKAQFVKDVIFREGSFAYLKADINDQGHEVPKVDLLDAFDTIDDESTPPSSIDSLESDAESKESEVDDELDSEMESSADESNSDSEPGDEVYEVESIQDDRTARSGFKEYLVKWTGYSKPTWEPAANIRSGAPRIVETYEPTESRSESNPSVATRTRSAMKSTESSRASDSASSSSSSTSSTPAESNRVDSESDDDMSAAIMAVRSAAAMCL